MIPVGANGERAPATAPWATMMAMTNAGIPVRPATAIAKGPTSAADAMLPAPIDAIPSARPKNMIGMRPAFPWQKCTPTRASRSMVPLVWAWAKSAVIPTSVRNSSVGNPAITALSPIGLPMHRAQVHADRPGKRDGENARD